MARGCLRSFYAAGRVIRSCVSVGFPINKIYKGRARATERANERMNERANEQTALLTNHFIPVGVSHRRGYVCGR